METAWIQVFVLTISECVAPTGKAICQEQAFELEFLTRADCETALEQLISLKDESQYVIVNPNQSGCAPAARERQVFDSLNAINAAHGEEEDLRVVDSGDSQPSATQAAHRERLASLKTCEESEGIAPCKIGEIIVEGASETEAEIWRSD